MDASQNGSQVGSKSTNSPPLSPNFVASDIDTVPSDPPLALPSSPSFASEFNDFGPGPSSSAPPSSPASPSSIEHEPVLTQSGRPRRNYQLPKRFQDVLPAPAETAESPEPPLQPVPRRSVLLVVRDRLVTAVNIFGIWRDYPHRPSHDPDAALTLEDLTDQSIIPPSPSSLPQSPVDASSDFPAYWPFPNASIHGIMKWLNNGQVNKSEADVNNLVHSVIRSPDFDKADLTGFDAHCENLRLDKALCGTKASLCSQFKETAADILVPSGDLDRPAQKFSVPGLLHRKLTSVISDAFNDPLAHMYHFSPFKLFRKSPVTHKDERVYGELYNSDAFLAEHEEIQRRRTLLPGDLEICKREKVVAALMFSSDATHLTDFGNAKAWPVYLMLGNLSKYMRAQPSCGALRHLAYIPSVSDPSCSTAVLILLIKFSCQIPFKISPRRFTASGAHKRRRF